MRVKIDASWQKHLQTEFDKPYFEKLAGFVRAEYKSKSVYPPAAKIFNAFDLCTFDNVKVVIIGQDPYHGPKQAHGLSFSVPEGVAVPPSLQNIYKEIKSDLDKEVPKTGNLERWAKQGVLLLNATLTVQAGSAGSHQNKGWEDFTDAVIKLLSDKKEHLVFLLWGTYAQKKGTVIDSNKHLVLTAAHPSPFSVEKGFFGCKHFSQTNNYLRNNGIKEIDW
jgi:uracil-DNA glycosylase